MSIWSSCCIFHTLFFYFFLNRGLKLKWTMNWMKKVILWVIDISAGFIFPMHFLVKPHRGQNISLIFEKKTKSNVQPGFKSLLQQNLVWALQHWWPPVIHIHNKHIVSPNKHGNSVTILNKSSSAWLAGTQPLNTFTIHTA